MEIYTELGLTNTQNIGGEFFYAPKKSAEFLTDAETAWLRKHPKIRVHNETNWPPFNFAKDGQAMGFSIDYMNLVASKVGLKVDYITGPTWSEFLGMMKSGKLDVMLNIVQTPERLEYLLYTKPYASNPNTILSRKDTPYTSLEELAGKTVAVPKGFYQEEILKRDFPQIKLHLVDDVLGGMKAVSFGQADATVGEFAIFNHLIESELMTGLFMSGELKMGATGLEKLWIATRKDLPVLRSILTKAMTAVSRGEKQKLVSRWIASASSEPKQPADTSSAETSKTVLFFLISIFGLLAAFGVIGIILKRSMGNRDISTFFGAPGFRISIMAGLSLLVAVVAIMNWLAISDSKERVVKGIGEELQIVLSSSIERLNIWVSQKQAFLRQLGKDRELVKITQELLKADRESSSLGRSLAVREARAFFTSNEQFGSTGFFIIAPDKINIGARENASLGTLNLIAEKHLGLIEKAFKGETVFVPPIRYDVKRGAGATVSAKNQPLTMFIATPIIDENGSVLAVLAEHIPSHGALSRILQFGRVGKSGETYAFNGEAKMVSESRFKDDLVALGLISNQSKIGAELDIRDPGGNMTQGYQPNTDPADRSMTKMIVGALKLRNSKTKTAQSEPSVNTGGYPDYRGVPVVGAWAWLHQLGLGVATEMDVEEAMADHAALRFNLIAISTVALVLAVGATLFTLLLGQRAHSSLTKARDELEDRVVERTLELANKEAQLRLAMDNMPGGMVLIDSEQNFLLFNQQYSELFDFPDDLIAEDRPILDMVSFQTLRGDYGGGRYVKIVNEMMKIFRSGEHRQYERTLANGRTLEVHLAPTPDGGAVLVATNITERKQAEERLSFTQYAVDNAADSVFWIRPSDAGLEYANNAACQILGYSHEELLKMQVPDFDFTFSAQKMDEIGTALQSENSLTFESRHQTKDGRNIDVLVSVNLADYLDRQLLIANVKDISERKESEKRLQDAFDVISSSIEYASRIQRSILPYETMLSSMCADHFVIWEPRDVVGGDIYWCEMWGDGMLIILGDCTGHGVPGAFMTLIATGALERAKTEVVVGDVAALIQRMHQLVQEILGQHGEQGESDDGMELGVCYLTENMEEMRFSGARFDLFIADNGEIETISGTKKGIGYRGISPDQHYDLYELELKPSQSFYMTSDGLIDQVGGEKRRGFGKRRFRELIASVQSYPLTEQREHVLEALADYQQDETRRDDVAVLGFKFE